MNLRQHKRRAAQGMKRRQGDIMQDPYGAMLIRRGGRRLLIWSFVGFADPKSGHEFKCLDGVSEFRGHIYSRF